MSVSATARGITLGAVLLAMVLGLAACALNTSRFHTDLTPIDFDILATKTFPRGSTCEEVAHLARRAGLDSNCSEIVIHPPGLYNTWGYAGTKWGRLAFEYDGTNKLDHMTYNYATRGSVKRYVRPVQWMGELQ